jgi:hypothetical protein
LDSKRVLEISDCDGVKNINITQPLDKLFVELCYALRSIVLCDCNIVSVDDCGIHTFSPAGIRSTAKLKDCIFLSTISEVKGRDAKRGRDAKDGRDAKGGRDAKDGCDLVTVTGCAYLTSVTDVSVIELDINQCDRLEKISGIPQLQTLTLRDTLSMHILEDLPKLQEITMKETTPLNINRLDFPEVTVTVEEL